MGLTKRQRRGIAKGRNKIKARQKWRARKRKKWAELSEVEQMERHHEREGRGFNGRWVGFGTFGSASKVRRIEITDELRARYETGD